MLKMGYKNTSVCSLLVFCTILLQKYLMSISWRNYVVHFPVISKVVKRTYLKYYHIRFYRWLSVICPRFGLVVAVAVGVDFENWKSRYCDSVLLKTRKNVNWTKKLSTFCEQQNLIIYWSILGCYTATYKIDQLDFFTHTWKWYKCFCSQSLWILNIPIL